jgi:hypothetical protein
MDFRFEEVPLDYYFPTFGMSADVFEMTFNFGLEKFEFDIEQYVEELQNKRNRQIFSKMDFSGINNNILNYFLINGYEKSFHAFYQFLEKNLNLKFIMNEKSKLSEVDTFYPNKSSFDSRSKSRKLSYHNESQKFINRRNSLRKIESLNESDNKEVLKLLNIRSGNLNRNQQIYSPRRHRQGSHFVD